MGHENAKIAGPPLPGVPNCFSLSVSDRLPQRRAGTIEEALHPTTPPSRIVIFANWFALLRLHSDYPHAAIADLHVAALVAHLQLAVEAEYRHHMKTIGYLGQIDRLFGAPATTRSWNTILSVLRILRSDQHGK